MSHIARGTIKKSATMYHGSRVLTLCRAGDLLPKGSYISSINFVASYVPGVLILPAYITSMYSIGVYS